MSKRVQDRKELYDFLSTHLKCKDVEIEIFSEGSKQFIEVENSPMVNSKSCVKLRFKNYEFLKFPIAGKTVMLRKSLFSSVYIKG